VIRAALFDFGGVISTSPFDAFTAYESANGLPAGFLRRVNATEPDRNAWAQLERGELTLDEFGKRFADEATALGHHVDGQAILRLLSGEIRPTMVAAIRKCSEHLLTGLLTNNFVAITDSAHLTDLGDVLGLFDAVVESSRIGVRKPEPLFYEIACEMLGIEPSEAVFLDDLGINLKPARSMGMTTIKVTDPAVAIAELETVLSLNLS